MWKRHGWRQLWDPGLVMGQNPADRSILLLTENILAQREWGDSGSVKLLELLPEWLGERQTLFGNGITEATSKAQSAEDH